MIVTALNDAFIRHGLPNRGSVTPKWTAVIDKAKIKGGLHQP